MGGKAGKYRLRARAGKYKSGPGPSKGPGTGNHKDPIFWPNYNFCKGPNLRAPPAKLACYGTTAFLKACLVWNGLAFNP